MGKQCKLTALQIKNLKPKKKEYQVSDGSCLYVRVYPNGRKKFVVFYTQGSQRVKETIGNVDDITLENARNIANQKIAIFNKIPIEYRGQKITLKQVFDEYTELKKDTWSKDFYNRCFAYERRFLVKISHLPIAEITRKDILNSFDYLIKRQHKVSFANAMSFLSCLFGWAVQNEYCQHNIIKDIEMKYLFSKKVVEHRAHLDDLSQVIKLKEQISNYWGTYSIKVSALLQLYTATRHSEARNALWSEFDLENGIWKIPASRMKMKKSHEIILSTQILELLKEYKERTKGNGSDIAFRGYKSHLAISSVRLMLRKLGYTNSDLTPHGFRGTFATIANELRDEHGLGNDIVQACLAHETQNAVASAYNHANYKKARGQLLQWWGDKLGDIKLGYLKKPHFYF